MAKLERRGRWHQLLRESAKIHTLFGRGEAAQEHPRAARLVARAAGAQSPRPEIQRKQLVVEPFVAAA